MALSTFLVWGDIFDDISVGFRKPILFAATKTVFPGFGNLFDKGYVELFCVIIADVNIHIAVSKRVVLFTASTVIRWPEIITCTGTVRKVKSRTSPRSLDSSQHRILKTITHFRPAALRQPVSRVFPQKWAFWPDLFQFWYTWANIERTFMYCFFKSYPLDINIAVRCS